MSYHTLFDNILKGISIQKRPPESYCDMCVGGPALEAERLRLDFVFKPVGDKEMEEEAEEANFPDWHYMEYGSKEKAMRRFKELGPLIDRRLQHKTWVKTQRKAVRHIAAQGICSHILAG